MQTFALAMLGAVAARHHHHHAPASVNYFAEGASEEETNAMPVHAESRQAHEQYLNDTDIANEANVQMKYNEAGLWQYELVQLQEDDGAVAKAADAAPAGMKDSVDYDMKLSEYGATEKVQSLNPIAYQYWSDMNQTGAFRRARSTWYWVYSNKE